MMMMMMMMTAKLTMKTTTTATNWTTMMTKIDSNKDYNKKIEKEQKIDYNKDNHGQPKQLKIISWYFWPIKNIFFWVTCCGAVLLSGTCALAVTCAAAARYWPGLSKEEGKEVAG